MISPLYQDYLPDLNETPQKRYERSRKEWRKLHPPIDTRPKNAE